MSLSIWRARIAGNSRRSHIILAEFGGVLAPAPRIQDVRGRYSAFFLPPPGARRSVDRLHDRVYSQGLQNDV